MKDPGRHDRFFRHHLGNIEIARHFLRHYLPGDLVAVLDLSTLEPAEARFPGIGEAGGQGDLAWSLRMRGEENHEVVVLLEHKSRRTAGVGRQILRYVLAIHDLAERVEGERPGAKRGRKPLPAVVPVLVYHGERPWRGSELRALTRLPEPVQRFVARVECVLVDLTARSDQEMEGPPTLRSVFLALKHSRDEDLAPSLPGILAALGRAPLGAARKRTLVSILRYLEEDGERVAKRDLVRAVRAVFPDREEEIMGSFSAELLEKGRKEGRKQGRKEGREQGREQGELRRARQDVVRALRARFRRVPRPVSSRIAEVDDLSVLDRLHDLAVTTPSMAEFRKELGPLDS